MSQCYVRFLKWFKWMRVFTCILSLGGALIQCRFAPSTIGTLFLILKRIKSGVRINGRAEIGMKPEGLGLGGGGGG